MSRPETHISECSQIFVIGAHRSGTTWLANCLMGIEGVFTPQAALHHGQIESAYFSRFLPYFNGAHKRSDKLAMFSAFEKTDFVGALKGDGLKPCYNNDPWSYFSLLMDNAARVHRCDSWVEKSPGNALVIDQLIDNFPKARFIFISRNYIDQSLSYALGLLGGIGVWNLFKAGLVAGIYRSSMRRGGDNIFRIRYEALRLNFDDEFGDCLRFLDFETREYTAPEFQPNSSYSPAYSDIGQKPVLNFSQRAVVTIGYYTTIFIPRPGMMFLLGLRRRIFRSALPDWVYASIDS